MACMGGASWPMRLRRGCAQTAGCCQCPCAHGKGMLYCWIAGVQCKESQVPAQLTHDCKTTILAGGKQPCKEFATQAKQQRILCKSGSNLLENLRSRRAQSYC